MLTPADRNRIAVNLLTARIIPLILAGVVGYATYVLVALCCVNYLLVKHNDKGAAIPILVTYFLLFTLMTACFIRLIQVTVVDPPYVPLGAAALRDQHSHNARGHKLQEDGIAMGEYSSKDYSGDNSLGNTQDVKNSYNDPDSPGLELFYTKDVFICGSMDGRPIWCSECSNWKPDRAHHDSSSGRCVRKMDHFCPWVGGPVGENNLKFFLQFNAYTAFFCFHLLVVMAYYIHKQVITEGESVNRQFIAILALATFFGLFTASMAATSLNLAALNLTQVEKLGSKTKVYFLAIFKTSDKPCAIPALGQITYPLDVDFKPGQYSPGGYPIHKENSIGGSAQDVEHSQNITSSTVQTSRNNVDRSQDLTSWEISEGVQRPSILHANMTSDIQQSRNGSLAERAPTTKLPLAQNQVHSASGTEQFSTLLDATAKVRETLSTRDAKATRTFTVLKLEPGENPWDLGSVRLNLETVMGVGFLDWLLPIRRSPCCDHEDGESQFKVGPKVALLRESMGTNQPF